MGPFNSKKVWSIPASTKWKEKVLSAAGGKANKAPDAERYMFPLKKGSEGFPGS